MSDTNTEPQALLSIWFVHIHTSVVITLIHWHMNTHGKDTYSPHIQNIHMHHLMSASQDMASSCLSTRDSHCTRSLPCSHMPPQIVHWVLIWVIFKSPEGQMASPQSLQIRPKQINKSLWTMSHVYFCCLKLEGGISRSRWSDMMLVGHICSIIKGYWVLWDTFTASIYSSSVNPSFWWGSEWFKILDQGNELENIAWHKQR